MNNKALGKHYIIDFYGCDSEALKKVNVIKKNMIKAGKIGELSIIKKCFHQFKPYGVSGVLVLKESHFTIHTWYEHNYASVDLYLCDQSVDVAIIIDYLRTAFNSSSVQTKLIDRGIEI